MNAKINGSNELFTENGFEGKFLRNLKDFELITSLTITKERYQIIGRIVRSNRILVILEKGNEKFTCTIQPIVVDGLLVLKYGNKVQVDREFIHLLACLDAKYYTQKEKDRLLEASNVPMTLEEIEERRIQELYRNWVHIQVNDNFIEPSQVSEFDSWLRYTYPKMALAEQKKQERLELETRVNLDKNLVNVKNGKLVKV